MKRTIIILITLLSISNCTVYAGDFYVQGVRAYNSGDYVKAYKYFERVVKINPRNVNARYYLSQIDIKNGYVSDAVDKYNKIIVIAPDSQAARLSQRGLSLIRSSGTKTAQVAKINELERYKDNYFGYVLKDDGSISKWQTFPLTVYIQPNANSNSVRKAFLQWQNSSKNLVSFRFVATPSNAKIKVTFKSKLESTSTDKEFFAGFSTPSYKGKYISQSTICLLTQNPKTKRSFDTNEIYATVLHEIGHSLGFVGHSPNENDVMSATTYEGEPKMSLTKRDINTLNMLYRASQKNVLSNKNNNTNLKIKQAEEYIKTTPNKYIGWSNLGDIYFNQKKYNEAEKYYQKAIAIEPDRANLYNSLGATYRLSGNKAKEIGRAHV